MKPVNTNNLSFSGYSAPNFYEYYYGFPVNDGIEAFLNVVRTVF